MCVTACEQTCEHGARRKCGFFRSVRHPRVLNNSRLDPMTPCFSVHLSTGPSVSMPSLRALLGLLDEKIINHRLLLQDLHLVLLAKLKIFTTCRAAGGRSARGQGHPGPQGGRGVFGGSLGTELGRGGWWVGALALTHCGLTV